MSKFTRFFHLCFTEFYKVQISTTLVAIYSLVCQVCFTYQSSIDGVRTKQNTRWCLTFPSPTSTGENYLFPFTVNTERMCGLLVIYWRMLFMPICVALIHAFIEQIESLKRNPLYIKNKKKWAVFMTASLAKFSPPCSGSFFRLVSSFRSRGSKCL